MTGPSSTKYPSQAGIKELFSALAVADHATFFQRVDPNVDWTVMGTSPLSGRYRTLKDFQEKTLARLRHCLQDTLKFHIRHISGGGDDAWAAVEMVAEADCQNGKPYQMCYCWVCCFNEAGNITKVRAYLDTALLQQVIHDHECPSAIAWDDVS